MEKIKFTVKMKVSYLVSGEDGYKIEHATKKFVLHNYDDLQNLLLTLIEASDDALDLTIDKEEVED